MVFQKIRKAICMEKAERYPSRKRRYRRYSGYFLSGIILVSFLAGLLVGVLSSRSNMTDTAEEAKLPTVTTSACPADNTTITPVPVISCSAEAAKPKMKYYDVPLSTELQDYISSVCNTYNVPCELIYGMIEVESNFRADTVSDTNDYGLMQINKCNHEWLSSTLGVSNFLDPKENILCGIFIISGHLEKTDGNVELALMRYNCGATGAKRLWEQGIYSTSYTDKVIAAYETYRDISN